MAKIKLTANTREKKMKKMEMLQMLGISPKEMRLLKEVKKRHGLDECDAIVAYLELKARGFVATGPDGEIFLLAPCAPGDPQNGQPPRYHRLR